MKQVEQWHSPRMQRPITLSRWGHFGVPVLVFPTAGGDAEEIERHHLVSHCGELLDAGAVKLFSCDSTAGAAMLRKEGTPQYRAWLLNQYQLAIANEVVPAIHTDCGGEQPVIVAGSSIGAFNALAVLCRFPWLFRSAICMSGTYQLQSLIEGYSDDLYFASPTYFVPGLDGDVLEQLRSRFVILASGEGAWENVGESWAAARVLGDKRIPNRVDNWGPDWEHEWPTWWAMLPQYLHELLG